MPAPSSDNSKPASADAESFLGLSEVAAVGAASGMGLPSRVVARDGKALPVTMDYRPERLNFTIENGVVARVSKG